MSTYIFYTDEGYTIAPNDEELESLQILGIEDGNTEDEAWTNLYENNKWIKENGFREENIRCYAMLKPNMLKEIKVLVSHLIEDIHKYGERGECPNEPVFQLLKRIQNLCGQSICPPLPVGKNLAGNTPPKSR